MESNATYKIVSRLGRVLDVVATEEHAQRLMAVWHSAKYVVRVNPDGSETLLHERKELQ